MRIYRRDEFLTLPGGVFFSRVYDRRGNVRTWHDGNLCVKDETVAGTPLYWSLDISSIDLEDGDGSSEGISCMESMAAVGSSRPLNTAVAKDCAEAEDLFLVYERADLLTLRGLVDAALAITADHGKAPEYTAFVTGEALRLESAASGATTGPSMYALVAEQSGPMLTFSIPAGSPLNPYFVMERFNNIAFSDHEVAGAKDRLIDAATQDELRLLIPEARKIAGRAGSMSGLWDAIMDAECILTGKPTLLSGDRRDVAASVARILRSSVQADR